MGDIRVYRGDELALRPAVEGARMWAIGLDKSMLTYFEIEPGTTFPDHSHESEQITLVLEGELVFVCDGASITLKAGDAVAIPSNKMHSAHTGKMPCRAVDAWSLVRMEFLSPAG